MKRRKKINKVTQSKKLKNQLLYRLLITTRNGLKLHSLGTMMLRFLDYNMHTLLDLILLLKNVK